MALKKYSKNELNKLIQNHNFPKNIENVFIEDVCQLIKTSNNVFDVFKDDEIIFYYGKIDDKNLISVDRKAIQKILKKGDSFKNYPTTDIAIENAIKKLTGNLSKKYEGKVLELIKGVPVGKKTQLKQDFTCFVCRYFFTKDDDNPYNFYNKFLSGNLSIDAKLSISSDISDFNAYFYPNNFEDLIDSISTALTIKKNSSKLKLNNLKTYLIAEENSVYGKHFKEEPYQRIKKNESNYYSAADKMTTADIFLYDENSRPKGRGKNGMQNYFSLKDKENLTHSEFSRYINKAMVHGYIVPISLKKLTLSDINDNDLTSSKISIINIAEKRKDSYIDDITDPFLLKVVELFSITEQKKFFDEMEKVIDIKKNTIKLNMYGTRATFDFGAVFKPGDEKIYDVFIQNNQIYIKPPSSTSNSGLGGVTLEYIKNQVIKELPKGKIFRQLIEKRREAFDKSFNFTYNILQQKVAGMGGTKIELAEIIKKYKIIERKYKNPQYFIEDCVNRVTLTDKKKEQKEKDNLRNALKNKKVNEILDYMAQTTKKYGWSQYELIEIIKNSKIIQRYMFTPLLQHAKLLSPSEYAKIFSTIPENQRDDIAAKYLLTLEQGIEEYMHSDFVNNKIIESKIKAKKEGKEIILSPKERNELIYSKLSSMEFLYYIGCDQEILLKWIKNALIMGIYGIASASGIIILNGKNINLGKFGKDAIKRRNSMYVKIGK